MTRGVGKHKFPFNNFIPKDPSVLPFMQWSEANRAFFDRFRQWLKESSYGESALNIYGAAVRTALGYLRKDYWEIDPDRDLPRVIAHLEERSLTQNTRRDYQKGLHKLDEYLRLTLHIPKKSKELRWEHCMGSLPKWLQEDIRAFLQFCQHSWREEKRFERSGDTLFTLSRALRWMVDEFQLQEIEGLTPKVWFAWMDHRFANGIGASSLNAELSVLKHFVYFLQDLGRPVCERFLLVDRLEENKTVPKDAPIEQLRLLQKAIQKQIVTGNAGKRRTGLMDLAWFLLMLHSGLRSGEIRLLKLSDIDWEAGRVRIEQSKDLKDRLVPMSEVTIRALHDYLEVRGPANALPENVFIFRDAPLSKTYLFEKMKTYGRRSGVGTIAPHRLRQSCGRSFGRLVNASMDAICQQEQIFSPWRYGTPRSFMLVSFQGTGASCEG
ncbi:MAG TPA: tyrosine-type recombinase/integrase [Anaerolineales bacterium]|nr:tyrosine-type recombinase/integrase [Anaerolineales bacterium]